MSRPRPPHLQRHKTRHGKFVWYFQIGSGPLVRIKHDFGTPEFDKAYQEIATSYGRTIVPKIRAATGTLEWAWLSYKDSGAWKGLSKPTRRQRENIMKNVLAEEGTATAKITDIDEQTIRDGVERRMHTPFQAKNWLQTIRGLFEWLVESKKLKVDPTANVSVKKPKTRGFLEWTDQDIEKYEKRWLLGTRERVMLDVYCYTGLRRGDAARVGPQHVYGNTISMPTEKSQGNTVVHLPLLDVLKRTLAAGPTGKESFICKIDGMPYTKESLGNTFKDACVAAGVLDKSAHGLRKAAATRAADNGATAHELMAIFGWIDIKEAEIYTRAADCKRLAKHAMMKLDRPPAEPTAAEG
jgi:integrase